MLAAGRSMAGAGFPTSGSSADTRAGDRLPAGTIGQYSLCAFGRQGYCRRAGRNGQSASLLRLAVAGLAAALAGLLGGAEGLELGADDRALPQVVVATALGLDAGEQHRQRLVV